VTEFADVLNRNRVARSGSVHAANKDSFFSKSLSQSSRELEFSEDVFRGSRDCAALGCRGVSREGKVNRRRNGSSSRISFPDSHLDGGVSNSTPTA
jgi:hypothetical protein